MDNVTFLSDRQMDGLLFGVLFLGGLLIILGGLVLFDGILRDYQEFRKHLKAKAHWKRLMEEE